MTVSPERFARYNSILTCLCVSVNGMYTVKRSPSELINAGDGVTQGVRDLIPGELRVVVCTQHVTLDRLHPVEIAVAPR